MLKGQGVVEPEAAARSAHRILAEHPGWPYNAGLERQVRLELYKCLRLAPVQDAVGDERLSYAQETRTLKATVDNLLRMQRVIGHEA